LLTDSVGMLTPHFRYKRKRWL